MNNKISLLLAVVLALMLMLTGCTPNTNQSEYNPSCVVVEKVCEDDSWKIRVLFEDNSGMWIYITQELYNIIEIGEPVTVTQDGELYVG